MVEFVSINGAELAFEIKGPEAGPLMITLHGGRGMGDHRSDFRIYSRLSDKLRVLSFDYRGHGQSSRTKPYTFEQIVDDIEGLREHFVGAEQPVIICGGSFGGFIAQHYAIKYASRVSHLVLRGTAPSHHHEEGAIRSLEKRLDKTPGFSVSMLRNKVFGSYESDREFQLVHFAMLPLYSEQYNADNGLRACLDTVHIAESHNDLYSETEKYFDYTDSLHRISAKTLIVVGDRDWICPLENSQLLAEKIPDARLFVVEGANHGVHVERPELVLGDAMPTSQDGYMIGQSPPHPTFYLISELIRHGTSHGSIAIHSIMTRTDPLPLEERKSDPTIFVAPEDEKITPPQSTPAAEAKFWHWHEPGTSPEEKKLIFKLDWFLLSFGCLMFFIKQLDQNNISNAYVSGMSEELGFGPGNELSWMNTYFSVGTIIGGTFANMIITVIRPRFWLPGCCFIWSLFVLFLFKCEKAHHFYVLRFFIGLFESAAWPGVMYCLGSWYRKSELARRSGLFVMSGVLGQMFSGYLQSALFVGMEGKGGLSAWRWLFIFDFILAIPVIVYGAICFPDTPHTTQAFYLNDWERKRACERIEEEGRKPVGKMNWSVFRRVFNSWQVYAFTVGYSFWTLTCGSYIIQYFTLYLKSTGDYTVPEINNIPTSVGAINFFFMIATGFVADKIGNRGPQGGQTKLVEETSKNEPLFLASWSLLVKPLLFPFSNSSSLADKLRNS
ncbi:hypothetical protein G7Z17_g606 [Cylindrodendrum hubeiense]|uniref:Major facilitator superfamily (MFS) profile domain-containing protein n=1 Tax=Cylindrodendrum hubeiense TaxID=595255 RepID=A0A9P5HPJ2_9HYPO|nr:hypothetical protein G7Z17_g606 [Cylindrodendrum hubeiense]